MTDIESKVPNISGLVSKISLNIKFTKIKIRIASTTGFVTKTNVS